MFYTYSQTNSGGSFIGAEFVIIESNSACEANAVAKEYMNIYFDGIEKEIDCPCCGDRWYPTNDSEGSDIPTIYGKEAEEFWKTNRGWLIGKKCRSVAIRYANGSIKYLNDDGTSEVKEA